MRDVIHVEDAERRSKAADLFGFAIARRWSISSQEARSWVEGDFLNPINDVIAAIPDGKIRAVLCVGPLSEASVPDAERALLCEQLGEPLFVTGLAVANNWEHRKLARAVHGQLRQDMRDWGFSSAVMPVLLPSRHRNRYAYHWLRMEAMGWRHLEAVPTSRQVLGDPVHWSVLR